MIIRKIIGRIIADNTQVIFAISLSFDRRKHYKKGLKIILSGRITTYSHEYDASMILDAYGHYETKWQFSSELVKLGLKILDGCNIANVSDTDTKPAPSPIPNKICLRAGQTARFPLDKTLPEFLFPLAGNSTQ